MTFRRLLVPLEDAPSSHAAAALARRLAFDLDATLLGIAATGVARLPLGLRDAGVLLDAEASLTHSMQERAAGVAAAFTRTCRLAGLAGCDARVVVDESTPAILAHVSACDLLVMGQPDPVREDYATLRRTLESVLLEGSRPVLVVPHANAVSTLGTTVLAAWDGGRESDRALAEALPLLARAPRVEVVRWQRHDGVDELERQARRDAREDLGAWLLAHGVQASVKDVVTPTPVGEALLSLAADVGADLIVAGAYGHARWSERVLGGVTRTLLDAMTVPVLLVH